MIARLMAAARASAASATRSSTRVALLAVVERLPYSVYTLRFTKRDDAIDAMVTIIRRGFLGLDDDPPSS